MASSSCVNVDNVKTCLSPLERVGLTIVSEAGFISLVCLLVLFCLILRNVIRYKRYAHGKWSLIQEPADAYVLSLFVADLLQSIGAFMDVRWIHRGTVEIGHFCTAQGTIQQLGETAVAMATTVLALHTFSAVWIRKGAHNLWVASTVIATTWLFVILFVAIAASTKQSYFNPTPFWCWIGSQYLGLRLAGEYIWLWIGLVASMLVYIPLFLWSSGYIAVDIRRWWKVSLGSGIVAEDDMDSTIRTRPDASSLAILAYPVAYSIVILPVSIVRWASFTGHTVPDAATFFSVFLHNMFGCANVILLLTTKPNVLLFEDPRLVPRGRFRQGQAPGESPSRSRSPGKVEQSSVELRPAARNVGALYDEDEEDHLGVITERRR